MNLATLSASYLRARPLNTALSLLLLALVFLVPAVAVWLPNQIG